MNCTLQLIVYCKAEQTDSLLTYSQKVRVVAYVGLDKVANVNSTTCAKIQTLWPALHTSPTLRASRRFRLDKAEAVRDQPRQFARQSSSTPWLHPQQWRARNLKCGEAVVVNQYRNYRPLLCSLEITIRRHHRVVEYNQEGLVHAPSQKLIASKVWAKLQFMTIMYLPSSSS